MSEESDLVRKTKGLQKSAEEKAKELNQLMLPLWANAVRGIPNEILRSALFNARNKKHARENLKNKEIETLFEGRIVYSGEELRQDDETVWLQLMHLARERPIGLEENNYIEFVPGSFIKSLNWPKSKQSYERLRDCLTRMQTTSLQIYSERLKMGVSMSMIPLFKWQDADKSALKKYKVWLASDLVKLFSNDCFSRLEWNQRLSDQSPAS